MIALALDPGCKLGWATNSTSYHAGQWGVFRVDDWLTRWYDGTTYRDGDLLARRLSCVGRGLDLIAHHVTPDLLVVERQLTMKGKIAQVNHRIEDICLQLAGERDICLAWPTPTTWQAWARRTMPERLTKWQTDGKPDDESARIMLAWALDTQKVEAA